ncbi:MAG: 2,3-bisphosphoglycerate-independent phosphoglycerate mutase [Candidatus Woesearchaeota archaeon]
MSNKKVLLIIRDGYGQRKQASDNAEKLAHTPCNDKLLQTRPHCLLQTCAEAVGLPKNTMGGSEVGHVTIGSGRIIWQNLELINRSIKDKSFFSKQAFIQLIQQAKKNNKIIHLAGLLQDKGVHAHQEHLFALLRLCKQQEVPREQVHIHIFSDGRDSPPRSLDTYVQQLQEVQEETQVGVIKTLIGRYYAMDRDTRWQRTKQAYDLLTQAKGSRHETIQEAIQEARNADEDDEFITAKVIGTFTGIQDGDVLIMYNYRTDRVRQLCKALLQEDFNEFKTTHPAIDMAVMTSYYNDIPARVAFSNDIPKNTLGEVVANNNLSQLRISETEKYPHVTFFFNGQQEQPFTQEKRVLIPSPREVSTYDQKPEMSIHEITSSLVQELDTQKHSLVVVNFVNADMVGHTGKLAAAIKAVEAVDACLQQTLDAALTNNYEVLVFADHGNCEEMAGEHQTSHTLNDVDCILVSNTLTNVSLRNGGLADIAPTALTLLGLEIPSEMTGQSLLEDIS